MTCDVFVSTASSPASPTPTPTPSPPKVSAWPSSTPSCTDDFSPHCSTPTALPHLRVAVIGPPTGGTMGETHAGPVVRQGEVDDEVEGRRAAVAGLSQGAREALQDVAAAARRRLQGVAHHVDNQVVRD